MRSVDLALFADTLAGEAAALQARAERARGRLRQASIERRARPELRAETVAVLESIGLLGAIDAHAARAELDDAACCLAAVSELQAWVEAKLVQGSVRKLDHGG